MSEEKFKERTIIVLVFSLQVCALRKHFRLCVSISESYSSRRKKTLHFVSSLAARLTIGLFKNVHSLPSFFGSIFDYRSISECSPDAFVLPLMETDPRSKSCALL